MTTGWPAHPPHGIRPHEVDLILDRGGGRHIGVEVKAASAPGPRDTQHLVWLRDQLGEQFLRGIVFHTGPHPFELGEQIWALPICALWAARDVP